jgi:hypothetical protein
MPVLPFVWKRVVATVTRLLTNIPSMPMVTEWEVVSIATYVAVLPENVLVRPGNIITLNVVEGIERVKWWATFIRLTCTVTIVANISNVGLLPMLSIIMVLPF